MRDPYEVLGIGREATPEQIRAAYRKLAKSSHPDLHPGDKAAETRFKEVSAAYDVIGDPERRREYDQVRAMGPLGARMGGGHAGPMPHNFAGADLPA